MAQAMTERCYRTEGLPQDIGACRGRFRAAALWAAHLSVTLRVPPPLKRGGMTRAEAVREFTHPPAHYGFKDASRARPMPIMTS